MVLNASVSIIFIRDLVPEITFFFCFFSILFSFLFFYFTVFFFVWVCSQTNCYSFISKFFSLFRVSCDILWNERMKICWIFSKASLFVYFCSDKNLKFIFSQCSQNYSSNGAASFSATFFQDNHQKQQIIL